VTAFETQAELNPRVAHLQAFLATVWSVGFASEFGGSNGGEVSAGSHKFVISLTAAE